MIVFRVDASRETGFGHLNRDVYLASLLKSKSEVLFCVNKDRTVTRYLEAKRCSYCYPKELRDSKDPAVRSIVFDVGRYGSEEVQLIEWAGKCPGEPVKTVRMADRGPDRQDMDYTVDASVGPPVSLSGSGGGGQPENRVSGPGYAILHTRFRHFNRVRRKYRKKAGKVLICFGAGVRYRRLRDTIDMLSRYRLEIKVAPGFYLKKSNQKILRRIYPGIRFVGGAESLARSFFEADAALVTAGMAAYEAAAAGTPALYFYYCPRQQCTARAFAKKGAGLEISGIDDIAKSGVIETIAGLDMEKRMEMGAKGKELVDGKGVYRVIDFFRRNGII